MKTHHAKKITCRSFLYAAVVVGAVLLTFATQNFAQKEESEVKRSTSRDGLADAGYMTKAEVSDDLEGTEDEYFYKFQARPGKLTLTLEVTANETNAGATLDLFGANSKAVLSNMLVQAADGGSESVSKTVNLAKGQDITIRVKGLRYGSGAGYPGVYKIRLEGPAVNFEAVPPISAGPTQTPVADAPQIPEATPASLPGQVQAGTPAGAISQTGTTETAPSGATSQDGQPAAAPASAAAKKPGKVDQALDGAKKKAATVLQVLEQVKTIKP